MIKAREEVQEGTVLQTSRIKLSFGECIRMAHKRPECREQVALNSDDNDDERRTMQR